MPIALAFTAGFIQSAISPTVLVTGMLELQRRGYGEAKSKPNFARNLILCFDFMPCTASCCKVQDKMTQACFCKAQLSEGPALSVHHCPY